MFSEKLLTHSLPLEASTPCRIDMGGTLDLPIFHVPFSYLTPSVFNISLNLRTHVRISPWKSNIVKVTSKGFDDAEYPLGNALGVCKNSGG